MAKSPASPATEFEAFAPFYDAFTAGSNYDLWTEHVLGVADSLGLAGRTQLDLACGTGKSFLPFLERGFDVTGCDISPAMLRLAAVKAPHVRLVEADLRAVPVLGRFDLVTCFDEPLNYLRDERELGAALAGVGRNLAPAGLALFDLNTLLTYRTTFATDSVLVRDGTTFVWRGEAAPDVAPGCLAAACIDIFAPAADGRFERTMSRHEQRHFPQEHVLALFAGAGLEPLGVFGVLDDGTPVEPPDESRHLKVLYAARLAKGGDER